MTARLNNKLDKQDDDGFDLVASGTSGQWSVFIDETHTGVERFYAQIEGPSIYCSFEIPSARSIETLLEFLMQPAVPSPTPLASRSEHTNGSLLIGGRRPNQITFIRDNEYADRCILTIGRASSGSVVRYSVEGSDLKKLTDALTQVREELVTEGLIPKLTAGCEYIYNNSHKGDVRVRLLKRGPIKSQVIRWDGVGESFKVPNVALKSAPENGKQGATKKLTRKGGK
jgi:hypothetical protein